MMKISKQKLLYLLMLVFLTACNENVPKEVEENILAEPWSQVEQKASNSEVNIFMWGGDEGVNNYIDDYLSPLLKEKHNIAVKRTPMDIDQVLQKLMSEKELDIENGTIDIIWLNGENFANAKDQKLLWESFSEALPNYQQFVDSTQYQYDFGTEVEGLEAPWGKVQYVFYYDSDKIKTPPTTFLELADWMKKNPGKFTYPEVQDFTGNAFLRHLLYEFVDQELLFNTEMSDQQKSEATVQVWQYLNKIKPFLWREGRTYPQSIAQLDQLYSQGEVLMTMGYNEARAESLITNGTFPKTTKSFVLESGSIGNTHYLSIPFNSPNKAAALVTINELLSPEAQIAKLNPEIWGENTVLSYELLPSEIQQQIDRIERGASVLSTETLEKAFLQELSTDYVEWLKEKWLVEVVQNK